MFKSSGTYGYITRGYREVAIVTKWDLFSDTSDSLNKVVTTINLTFNVLDDYLITETDLTLELHFGENKIWQWDNIRLRNLTHNSATFTTTDRRTTRMELSA